MEIVIPYKPRTYQRKVHNSTARFKVVVFHRQAGKTTMAVNELIKEATSNPDKVYWYIAPTYRQAKDVVWKNPEMLFKYLPSDLIKTKNEVELSITLVNNSVIQLKGADNPDSLRGNRPKYVVMDEYGDMKEDVWDLVLRPVMTAQPDGKVLFIGTPKGRNHFYKIFNYGKENFGRWASWMLKASESGIISNEDLEDARKEMPESAYLQEFECDFLEDASAVFKNVENFIYFYDTKVENDCIYNLGVDLGKYHDYTVITPFNLHTFEVLTPDRFNKIDWQLQKSKIEASYLKHNRGRVRLDSTGLGDPIFDDLTQKGINIEPYKFSERSREDLLNNLIVKLEQGQIRLPNYGPLIEELKSFRYELVISPSGRRKIYMRVPEGLHDDCVMSLALALWEIPNRPYRRDKFFDIGKKEKPKKTISLE